MISSNLSHRGGGNSNSSRSNDSNDIYNSKKEKLKKNGNSNGNSIFSIIKKLLKYGSLLLLAVMIFNTIMFTSKQPKVQTLDPDHIDSFASLTENELANRLSKAIQFKTISFGENKEFDHYEQEFLKFHSFLKQTFPKVYSNLEFNIINGYSLLYHWKGSDSSLNPVVLSGHIDVVPISNLDLWTHQPFDGTIADGYIWGRGAMDDKQSVMAILEAAEELLGQGFKPSRSLYFAFGHDEELGGAQGAQFIAQHLREKGVKKIEYLLDEGLPILLPPVFPGISRPIASIGVSEKGAMNVELSIDIVGGHSSMPGRETAIGLLARAVARLEQNPVKHSTKETSLLFDFVGREASLPFRFLFSNLWFFEPIISRVLAGKPSLDSLQRTTTAITMFNAGNKANVLPHSASALVNFRILPSDGIDNVVKHVIDTINDPRIKVNITSRTEPAPVSPVTAPSFTLLQSTLLQEFPDVIVAPTIMVANTDTRWYWEFTSNIYRFCPMLIQNSDLTRFHGIDERISTKNYHQLVDFYYHLIRNGDKKF
ncbi:hypothetical protein CYY_005622 [Polysphondylium violaceum]|uniref:Peptidase M20 dimerisation domain-containing protein n=1 Tax=Polysphondylium violaceum TaxID=133409 RepID=A0A8J4V3Z6_9MYCE|nr:hypothetical protein CYY_005622 [Polysphondylium violaceum]